MHPACMDDPDGPCLWSDRDRCCPCMDEDEPAGPWPRPIDTVPVTGDLL